MNPQQDQQPQNTPTPPIQVPPSPVTEPPQGPTLPPPAPKKSHKKLALFLLLGPTALLLLAVLLYAVSNFVSSAGQPAANSEELFAQPSPISAILNIFIFFLGVVGVIAWLPGVIIGVVLLSKK